MAGNLTPSIGRPSLTAARPNVGHREHRWQDVAIEWLKLPSGTQPEHAHPHLQVAVPIAPRGVRAVWRTDSGGCRRGVLHEGDVCVAVVDQPHTLHWDHGAELVFIHLSPVFLDRAGHDLGVPHAEHPRDLFSVRDPLLHHLGLALRDEFLDDAGPNRLRSEAIASVLAVRLLGTLGGRTSLPPTFGLAAPAWARVIEYVDANLDGALSLADLAAVAELSPYHFARAFKRTTGESPHRYVLRRRIERARDLLARHDLTLTDVGCLVGFHTQSHFTAVFRRHLGTTPGAFRLSLRGRT